MNQTMTLFDGNGQTQLISKGRRKGGPNRWNRIFEQEKTGGGDL